MLELILLGKNFVQKKRLKSSRLGATPHHSQTVNMFTFVFIDEKWKNENEVLFECYSCVSYCHFPFICEE